MILNERRKFIRHQMCFPLKYKVVKNGPLAKSETMDIGMGGMLFSARKPVKPGTMISVEMPFQNKIFNLKAVVAHCKKSGETNLYNIGVAFRKLSAAYKIKLIEQLYLISEFRDIRSIELGRQISLEKASKEWIRRYSDRFSRLYW